MRHILHLVIAGALTTSGCLRLHLDRDLATERAMWRVSDAAMEKEAKLGGSPGGSSLATFSRLDSAIQETDGGDTGGVYGASVAGSVLPGSLRRSGSFRKLLLACRESAAGPEKKIDLVLNRSELEELTGSLLGATNALTAREPAQQEQSLADSRTSLGQVIQKYLVAYYNGEFVDRDGTKVGKPEIKDSVDTATITAALSVVLEAVYDHLLETPVLYTEKSVEEYEAVYLPVPTVEGQEALYQELFRKVTKTTTKYQIPHDKEPSAAKILGLKEKLVKAGEKGIDPTECRAIRYLAGVAGDKSKTLSGMVVRALGGLELAYVFGGHFAIGGNDTFSKVVETTFEVTGRRTAEALAYRAFMKSDFIPKALGAPPDAAPDAVDMPRMKELLNSISQ